MTLKEKKKISFLSGYLLLISIAFGGFFLAKLILNERQDMLFNDFQMGIILFFYFLTHKYDEYVNYAYTTSIMKYIILPINSYRKGYSTILYVDYLFFHYNEKLSFNVATISTIASAGRNIIFKKKLQLFFHL
jgi:hypothetical protein